MTLHLPRFNARGLWRYDLLLIALVCMLYFSIGLGNRPYMTPEEARSIEISRQMHISGDFITPRAAGAPYLQTPPLFYWLQAGALALFGMHEWAGRSVSVICMALNCLLAYALARSLHNRSAGLMAAGALATSLLGYGLSHLAFMEVPLVLCIGASIACCIQAQQSEGKKRRLWYLLMYPCAALAVMLKGMVGLALPLLIVGVWLARQRTWHRLKVMQALPGALLFLLIVLPWHIAVTQQHPEFINAYLWADVQERASRWAFAGAMIPGFLPWSGMLLTAVRTLRPHEPASGLLIAWIGAPLLYYMLLPSPSVADIFVIYPPMAVLVSKALSEKWNAAYAGRGLQLGALGMLALLGTALIMTRLGPALTQKDSPIMMAYAAMPLSIMLPLALTLIALYQILIHRKSGRLHIIALCVTASACGFVATFMAASMDTTSIKPLAIALKPQLQADDRVVAYQHYWHDLPVYLEREVLAVAKTASLEGGADKNVMEQQCAQTQGRLFVFMQETEYAAIGVPANCPMVITARRGNTIMLEKTPRSR